ncbi:Trm112 family protein [Rhodospira trueperi]|uniref:UPF0434 protein SAMN05421720_105184 n=1 Tax=Rhodospira trueperi TaxID=69960 RepID=A0A1G7BW68_9PROT|nr:Trm112 family protein [Rhodospira trueperi]SDE30800.1 hypothetical protein SAMN05421720_105184 [Rhodospira trueperi]
MSETDTETAADRATDDTPIDPKLLEILVCPLGKGPLEYDRENRELISRQAGLAFPIRDGVPIMLIDEARTLDDPAPGSGFPAA